MTPDGNSQNKKTIQTTLQMTPAKMTTPMVINVDKDDTASKRKMQSSAPPSGSSPVKKNSKEVTFKKAVALIDVTGAPVTPMPQDDWDRKPAAKPKKTMLEAARGSKPGVPPIFTDPKKATHAHMGYIDVNIKIPAVPKGGNVTEHFRCHLMDWILMIQENIDPTFIVYAYLTKDLANESDALHKPKELGKTLSSIRKYANNVQPQLKEQVAYMSF